ncbi:MAG TPA: hypothetical protein VJM46_02980, partial [Candidatus Saccharimonadales bacterium]|nr:hypothetical protein [Candidatus Saccharimonadales bacterium]
GVTVDKNPAVGSVAWWDGGFHVAWVSAVNGKKVTIEEYNGADANNDGDYDGTYGNRTINASSPDGYIHFKDLDASTQPSANNTVLRVIKKNQSDGTNVVYWAKADSVYESWWRPGGDGVHHSKLVDIPQGDVKDIDVQILSDGLHLLYTETAHNIYETWWRPNQGLHTSNPPIAHTDNTIRKVIKTVAPDGVHQLYAMTEVGVDEYWWRPGGTVNKSRVFTLANPVAMKKFFEPDGRQSLYVADQGYAYEVWWRPGVPGITVGQIIRIAQNDIVDLDLTVDPGTNQHHLFVGEAGSGAWEAAWTPGAAGISYWHLSADNGVRAIQAYRYGSSYNLYVATAGGVYEYWWPAGTRELRAGTIVGGLSNVREFDRSTSVDGAQTVYTAYGTNIAETYWWGPGQPLATAVIE